MGLFVLIAAAVVMVLAFVSGNVELGLSTLFVVAIGLLLIKQAGRNAGPSD